MITSLLLLASVASAQTHYSPTLTVLQGQAEQPVGGTLEDTKVGAGTKFTGETAQPSGDTPVSPVDPSGKVYIMEGTAPIPGINIYKPKLDPNGNGRTEKPEAKPLINPKMTYGALGLGAALTVAGLFFTPLLFLGGLLLGAGAVLYLIGKKTKPKN